MSWGYKVTIILVVFLIGMISMVYISMRQTNEMVDANYYERELKYQNVIDAKDNLAQLNDSVKIVNNGRHLVINLPEQSVGQLDSGKIEFIRMANSKDDKIVRMKARSGGEHKLPTSSFTKGWYKVRVEWSSDEIVYYDEKVFNVE